MIDIRQYKLEIDADMMKDTEEVLLSLARRIDAILVAAARQAGMDEAQVREAAIGGEHALIVGAWACAEMAKAMRREEDGACS